MILLALFTLLCSTLCNANLYEETMTNQVKEAITEWRGVHLDPLTHNQRLDLIDYIDYTVEYLSRRVAFLRTAKLMMLQAAKVNALINNPRIMKQDNFNYFIENILLLENIAKQLANMYVKLTVSDKKQSSVIYDDYVERSFNDIVLTATNLLYQETDLIQKLQEFLIFKTDHAIHFVETPLHISKNIDEIDNINDLISTINRYTDYLCTHVYVESTFLGDNVDIVNWMQKVYIETLIMYKNSIEYSLVGF